ncbi:hypothetical protein BRN43_21115, partial [Xanthomonas oryzae pv. oryzae]
RQTAPADSNVVQLGLRLRGGATQ